MCIRDRTSIDPWFLVQIEEIVTIEGWMRSQNLDDLDELAPVSYTHLDVYKRQDLAGRHGAVIATPV